jgi:hypothetical protein
LAGIQRWTQRRGRSCDELYGEEFESLRDRDRFAAFVLDYGLATIAWENGVDFAPDYLYERLNAVH